jgi:hypothetical protein
MEGLGSDDGRKRENMREVLSQLTNVSAIDQALPNAEKLIVDGIPICNGQPSPYFVQKLVLLLKRGLVWIFGRLAGGVVVSAA